MVRFSVQALQARALRARQRLVVLVAASGAASLPLVLVVPVATAQQRRCRGLVAGVAVPVAAVGVALPQRRPTRRVQRVVLLRFLQPQWAALPVRREAETALWALPPL